MHSELFVRHRDDSALPAAGTPGLLLKPLDNVPSSMARVHRFSQTMPPRRMPVDERASRRSVLSQRRETEVCNPPGGSDSDATRVCRCCCQHMGEYEVVTYLFSKYAGSPAEGCRQVRSYA